jgi:imidazolonepropionase-like amidohydrolase
MKTPNPKLHLRILIFSILFSVGNIVAQDYFPKNDGVKSKNTNYTAFTNATIYVTPTQILKKGTLLIQNGKVANVGVGISLPKNVTVIDVNGKSIYPSFIDVYSDFGIVTPKRKGFNFRQRPQYDSKRKGYYWNEHIRPETNAIEKFKFDAKKATALRKAGFGVVNTHFQDGIVRGTGVLTTLNTDAANRLLDNHSAQYLSFDKSNLSNQAYPTSLMGAIALLRQLYYDADWYSKGNVTTKDISIEALNNNKNLPQIFYANDKDNALRADKLGDQFGIQYTIVGKGNEYQLVHEIKKTNATFIIPLNFPKAYDVENPFQADYVSLEQMRYWNQAPSNPGVLAKNGIRFSLTPYHLKSLPAFKKNLLKAIEYGLDKTKALEALTTIPAQILRKGNQIGTLKKGMLANFLITSGDIFDKKTILYENWVQGNKTIINDINRKDIRGDYTLVLDGTNYDIKIGGSPDKPNISAKKDSVKIQAKLRYKDNWLGIILTEGNKSKRLRANITKTDNVHGKAVLDNGKTVAWTATKKESAKKGKSDKPNNDPPKVLATTYPNKAYGMAEKPKQETLLFKNATVWTNEKEGILQQTDVLVKNGKIAKIGTNLSDKNAKIIDATGKHLTSGIIDEHSHIAAASINEAGHNSSAEVSIADNINAEDINIYRNLAGGVTISQILHGSANPIGGRSAILKLRWGETGDKLLYKNASKFIKFALGENVKQSNWGSTQTIRFPQTRMGVEQVYNDYFQRAKEYDALKKSGKPYRKDVEMETLAEILNGERFITCHSYVQSEINMLMKVAEKFNFKVNTFTHILEGYKVADIMKKHGAGASTFSDWWAYKYEVNDAIPQNAAILNSVGIVTAINSDDREMSRRLNQEAAKSVKYGDMTEEDAWKMVTLNPAKLLHIDQWVGSIKVGKDADLVLWSGHPLSVYAKAEKTLIDGKVYFDIERDKQQRNAIKKERNQLINLMLNAKSKGAPTQTPKKKEHKEFHCDTVD